MGILVKLIGRTIGMASEAIHDARANSNSSGSSSQAPGTQSRSVRPAGSSPSSYSAGDAPPEYIEVADEAAATQLIRSGRAERVVDYPDEKKKKPLPSDDEDNSDSDSDADTDIGNDEAVWDLDEMAERVAPPSYTESEAAVAAEADAVAQQPEEAKVKKQEQMVRNLVRMVGPAPAPAPGMRLRCPVIIPQRRPRNKDRGFVRAYAPVLQECGIGQEVFLKFLDDFIIASKASPWIDVVFVAAGIVGFVPEAASQIVSTVVQIAAGTAREMQSRSRRNTYLDMVNQQVFMPRGLFAMIMAFKDDVPGQQRGPLSRLAGSVGTMFASERLDIEQTAAKYSSQDPNMSSMRRNMQNMRLASGKTVGMIELPQAAELVYPGIDQAVRQELAEGDGKGKGKAGFKDKISGGMTWMQDYLDRRERALYTSQNPNSSLAVPSAVEKPFHSRFSDPNHPANSGSLVALLTGGAINPAARREQRRADKRERRALKHEWKDARREMRDQHRMARGKSPRGPRQRRDRPPRPPRGQRQGVIKKLMQQDVLYLIIVNLPSQQEVDESVARLEGMYSQARAQGNEEMWRSQPR